MDSTLRSSTDWQAANPPTCASKIILQADRKSSYQQSGQALTPLSKTQTGSASSTVFGRVGHSSQRRFRTGGHQWVVKRDAKLAPLQPPRAFLPPSVIGPMPV